MTVYKIGTVADCELGELLSVQTIGGVKYWRLITIDELKTLLGV